MDRLDQHIAAIRDESSYLWMFYHPDECAGLEDDIEARLDIALERVKDFQPPIGWTLHHIQWDDSVFIRSRQSMSEEAISEMLIDLIRFAHSYGGKLHSWLHGAENLDVE